MRRALVSRFPYSRALSVIKFQGNSHVMMMDKNNGEVADLIQGWLARKGLYK